MDAPTQKAVVMSDEARSRLEQILLEFDLHWGAQALAGFSDRVPRDDVRLRRLGLVELIKIDLERQRQAGHPCAIEDYLCRFPELVAQDDAVVDLARAEWLVRVECGEVPDVAEYERRFPALHERLARALCELSAKNLADPACDRTVETSRDDSKRETPRDSAPASTVLPERFGRYRVVRCLGEGGMGAVYLAYDTALGRQVALKIPKSDRSSHQELQERFCREARAAAHLKHPNICPVYDIGEQDGVRFISMAHIEGQPLSAHVKSQQRWDPREAATVIHKLAGALQEAHDQGVVHRDLKPANVMIDQRGEPIIMDFGLAQQRESVDQGELTRSGVLLGTPAYMSPEQVAGDNDQVGAASDIYSLGVILYELLTGQLPWAGPVREVLASKLTVDVLRPTDRQPDIDSRLNHICTKMLRRNPDDRYQSMRQVAEDLQGYLEKEKARESWPRWARQWSGTWRQPRWLGRSGTWWLVALAAVIPIVSLAVVLLRTPWGTLHIDIRDPDLQVSVDGQRLTITDAQQPQQLKARDHEFAVLLGEREVSVGQRLVLNQGEHQGSYQLSIQLDGAVVTGNKFTIVRNKQHVLTVALLPAPQNAATPEAAGTAGHRVVRGRFVFSAFDGRQWDVYTADPATGRLANVTRTSGANETNPRFSPNGQVIAFQSNQHGFGLEDRQYDVYVLEDGQIRRLTTRIGWGAGGLAWSPSGTEVLAAVEQWENGDPYPAWTNWLELRRIPLRDGEPVLVQKTSQLGAFYGAPDWHANGQVVVARFDAPVVYPDIFVLRLDGDDPPQRLTDTALANFDPRWSPDGRRLSFASQRESQGLSRLYVMNADGTALEPRFHEAAVDMYPVPIDDGKQVAFVRHPSTAAQLMVADADAPTAQSCMDLGRFKEVRTLDWTAVVAAAEGAKRE